MKLRNLIGTFLIVFILMGSAQLVQAQKLDQKLIRKELKEIMRELPVEAQQDILRYAEAKKVLVARQQAEEAEAPAQAAAPATPSTPQTVDVAPRPSAVQAAPRTTGHPPQRPKYMLDAEALTATTVDWYVAEHDFGEIKQGETVKYVYRFKNTGEAPLKLTRVKASCGCTTPSWSQKPIPPGEEGFIEVAFNSTGKMGNQRKTVVVTGNFDPVNKILRFQGNVVAE